jgi:hypothetical protein
VYENSLFESPPAGAGADRFEDNVDEAQRMPAYYKSICVFWSLLCACLKNCSILYKPKNPDTNKIGMRIAIGLLTNVRFYMHSIKLIWLKIASLCGTNADKNEALIW